MSIQELFISHSHLLQLLSSLVADGSEVFAPRMSGGKLFFARVAQVAQIVFDPGPTIESPKSVLFPRVERLLSYERADGGIRIEDPSLAETPRRVLFGARPCDAAALRRLADFFAAEIPDAYVAKRRERLTIISVSCAGADADCFCTSMGLGPGDSVGSDILLTSVGNDRYLVESVTERGDALLHCHGELVGKGEAINKQDCLAHVEILPSFEGFPARLAAAFDNPLWKDASLRCLVAVHAPTSALSARASILKMKERRRKETACGAGIRVGFLCSHFTLRDTTRVRPRVTAGDSESCTSFRICPGVSALQAA